jgi:hypothetical protein
MKRLLLGNADIDCLDKLTGYDYGVTMFIALLPALASEPSEDGDGREVVVTQEAADRLSEALHRATRASGVEEQTRVAAALLVPRLLNLPPALQGMSAEDAAAFLDKLPDRG